MMTDEERKTIASERASERILWMLSVLIGILVALFKVVGILDCGWMWVYAAPISFVMLSCVLGFLVYLIRAILELTGIIEMNVEAWVKIQTARWIKEQPTNWDDVPIVELSDDDITSAEESFRKLALESHKKNNWNVVIFLLVLLFF
jgi:hypothetical protein